ncbi:MAG: 50S ribosomal protein L4 [Parcubacteria group bacterium]|nr:50S ribosomal protein L4 [Parcubacteria group bacterium]
MTIDVYDKSNNKAGTADLPDDIFGRKWNAALVHQVITAQQANRRKPVAHAKGRSEVRGGGRKPWRQKGTGRARHGSIRSPLWKGGGVTHGPTKERSYEQKINKKMRRLAIFTVLSAKVRERKLKVIDSLELDAPKTKLLFGTLGRIADGAKSVLLIPADKNASVYRAAANMPRVKALAPGSLNVYDLMRYEQILLDRSAIETIAGHYKV